MTNILKCTNGHYTLNENCNQCKAPAFSPAPPKFSLEKEEKYGKYRRMAEK